MLLALFSVAWSQHKWAVEEFPNPLTQPEKCGIDRKSLICDPDHPSILSNDGRARVQAAIEIFDQLEVDCGKTEMGVAVMRLMKDDTSSYAEEMARGLMDKWGVGKKECNNGVVLVLSVLDRKVHFFTGSGARKSLPDAEIAQIVLNMKSDLRKQNYAGALESGISQAAQVINGHSYAKDQKETDYTNVYLGGFIALIMGCGGYSIWKERRENRRYSNCKQVLTRIEEEHARALATRFETFDGSCPICLEPLKQPNQKEGSSDGYEKLEEIRQEAIEATAWDKSSDIAPPGCVCLRCGHGFHHQCLDSWEAHGAAAVRNCPVCRSAVDGRTVVRRTNADLDETSSALSRRLALSRRNQLDWQTDRMFRLNRLRHYYPEYLSEPMLERAHRDASLVLSADASFVHKSPDYQRALDRAHHGTSATTRTSFGGGCSTGGGGGGGTW